VEQIGSSVQTISPGDSVALAYTYCGECPACLDERTYECRHFSDFFSGMRRDGTSPISLEDEPVFPLLRQGGFATHVVCHENGVTKVDSRMPLSLLAPIGCGIMTGAGSVMHYLKPRRDRPLAVFGTGPVGLSAIMAARIAGASPIIAVDRIPDRLNMARQLGATHSINTNETPDPAAVIREICGGIDYGFDTSGNTRLLTALRETLNPGGKACGVGIGGSLHFNSEERAAGKRWASTDTGWSVPQQFLPELLEQHEAGRFPFDDMIRTYPFEKINDAFNDVEKGTVIKAVLVMNETEKST
jgi:aryl-alcohol dehydrogenase